MPSAGGQVPTETVAPASAKRLGDGEAEPAVVGDACDESPLAGEIDGKHVRGVRVMQK